MNQIWQIMTEELYMATVLHSLEVHSFVLMSNHFHMLCTTPQANLGEVMKRFLEITSKRIGKTMGRKNRIWGARYYKSIITDNFNYLNVYKYNYYNPVSAKLSTRCELYKYSSLPGLLGFQKIAVPLSDKVIFSDLDGNLAWLNSIPEKDKWDAIKVGLKKSVFRYAKEPNDNREAIGKNELL